MKFSKGVIFFLFFILIIINIFYYLKIINLGNELFQLEKEGNKIKIENKIIESQINKIDNLNYLSSKAAELGLKYQLKFWHLEPEKYALSR